MQDKPKKHPEITKLIKAVKKNIPTDDIDMGIHTPYTSQHNLIRALKLLEKAQNYVIFSTDMKDTHPTLLDALTILAQKGVEVRININVYQKGTHKYIQKHKKKLEELKEQVAEYKYSCIKKITKEEMEECDLVITFPDEDLLIDGASLFFYKEEKDGYHFNPKVPMIEEFIANTNRIFAWSHSTYRAAARERYARQRKERRKE